MIEVPRGAWRAQGLLHNAWNFARPARVTVAREGGKPYTVRGRASMVLNLDL